MISISQIHIRGFRSILDLKVDLKKEQRLIAICGENNVGKTNMLRAINLFFNPENYEISSDRPTLKHAQGGNRIDPKISIEFYDSDEDIFYHITRDLKLYDYNKNKGFKGEKYTKSPSERTRKQASKEKLENEQIINFLNKIEFNYIESININIPLLVEQLTTDIIDVEFEKSKMTTSRKSLRSAYNDYVSGLQEILDKFSASISSTFHSFKNNWNISFNIPTRTETFRDLISDDVELRIDDKGCSEVEQKGSGLQRLAVILLHFEIAKRMKKKKSCIICVDEPDIYLHEGLQRKLNNFFEENSKTFQIIYTTHSKTFINQHDIRSTILLDSKQYPQYSVRKKREISVSETKLVDTSSNDGFKKICNHLGIEKENYEILEKENILVEGECDKKYLEEFAKYFSIKTPNIISLNGVCNCINYLDFYESFYCSNGAFKPKIKIIFDNDRAGREIYSRVIKKIDKQVYKQLDIYAYLLPNHTGQIHDGSATNHEIEDFIYPPLLCYLVNCFLSKMKMAPIDKNNFLEKIQKKSFLSNGVLSILDHEKNDRNPENGAIISFVSSSSTTNSFKMSLAKMFNIYGDNNILNILNECERDYPDVEIELRRILDFSNT